MMRFFTLSLTLFLASLATRGALAQTWVTFHDCPVMLENLYVVPAKDSGIVDNVSIQLNEFVKKGQLLVTLEKDRAELELQEAKEKHARAVELAADQGEVKLRRTALKIAKEELDNNVEIANSVSSSEIRRLTLAVEYASVALSNAENAFKLAGRQADSAAMAVKAATMNLANRDIYAPSEGIVTALKVHPGQWVEMGKPVMEISDLRQLQVDCLVPIEKTDLKKLVGLDVRIESNHRTATGAPIRLSGKITSYDPKVTTRGEVRVHCRIQNVRQGSEWLLLPDMNVRLEVAVPTQSAGEVPALISRRPK